MNTKQKLLFFATFYLLALATSTYAGSQGISLHCAVDKNTVAIGEPLTYTVTFTYPDSYTLQVATPAVALGLWEVKDFLSQKRKDDASGNTTIDLIYTLTTFTTGLVPIPENMYTYTADTQEAREVAAREIQVTVESVLEKLGDAGDIRDIKPPFYLRYPAFYYAVAVALALVAGAALYLW